MISFPDIDLTILTGLKLERYVAAIFQAQGYFVERNLRWSETRVGNPEHTIHVLEADILAYNFFPFGENRVLIECKGGGTFNDLFKFIGIKHFIKPDSAIFVCNNTANFEEIKKIGNDSGIIVLKPQDIINKFNDISKTEEIKLWYWFNEVDDALLKKENLMDFLGENPLLANQQQALIKIKAYYSKISSQIWKSSDPIEQSKIIETLFFENKDFVRYIGSVQGITFHNTEAAIDGNILCDSAANVFLKAKLHYIVSALRCAIKYLTSTDNEYLDKLTNPTFRSVVEKMINNMKIACRLPTFMQYWIYQYGGELDINVGASDLSFLAKHLNEREDTINSFLTLLEEIFSILINSSNISWSFYNINGIKGIKAVPNSIRGFGINLREFKALSVDAFVYRVQWKQRLQTLYNTVT